MIFEDLEESDFFLWFSLAFLDDVNNKRMIIIMYNEFQVSRI